MPIEIKVTDQIMVELVQQMGGDHSIVAAAKVSNSGRESLSYKCGKAFNSEGKPWTSEDSFGLINYLMKHRHGTPFEHSAMTFYVYAPIFVWREWHRHRVGFSYNEESARYKKLEPTFYIPSIYRPMMKVDNWKPGRPKFEPCTDVLKYNALVTRLKDSYRFAYECYINNLEDDFDPGLARDCLPVGIYSGCWVTCNPRSLMSFLSLRVYDEGSKFISYPLWEIQEAALACECALKMGWPLTYRAFVDNGRVAP